jgi:hypothetical protein
MDAPRAITVDPATMRRGLIRRLTALSIIPANVMGAVTVYFYYGYVDPLARRRRRRPSLSFSPW